MNKNLILSTAIILLVLTSLVPAQANMLDDLKNRFNQRPYAPGGQTIPVSPIPYIDQTAVFTANLWALNTPQAIDTLNAYMDAYGVRAVRVHVNRLPWRPDEITFYVVRGAGVVFSFPNQYVDKEIVLSYNQVAKLYPLVADGELSIIEQGQAWWILRFG